MAVRAHGRGAEEARPIAIEPGVLRHAEGSALIRAGETRVLCAASVEPGVPRFLRGAARTQPVSALIAGRDSRISKKVVDLAA